MTFQAMTASVKIKAITHTHQKTLLIHSHKLTGSKLLTSKLQVT